MWRWWSVLALCAIGCSSHSPRFAIVGPVPAMGSAGFEAALFQTVGARLQPGHRWQLDDDDAIFTDLAALIGRARASVDIDLYIWHSGDPGDRIVAALGRRAAGVTCRVLVDSLGSPDFEANVAPKLRTSGCEARVFRPPSDGLQRDHRKIVVVDGATGCVGGFGMRTEWANPSHDGEPMWRDINLRLEGPAVADLQRAFAQNWQEAGGPLLPASDFPSLPAVDGVRAAVIPSAGGQVTDAARLVHLVIGAATHRLWIWNAYFVPDAALLELLVQKRAEGVDVRLLLPGDKNDVQAVAKAQRRTYRQLLAGGVRIFEFQPTMMHAKTIVVDDRLALVGSINLDDLSLGRQDEVAALLEDPALVARLAADWERDVARSHEIPRR